MSVSLASSIKVELVTIDPNMAAQWLEFNTNNRTLDQNTVEKFASDVAARRWSLNGETVKFDREGRLIDGQHRLSAIVAANTPARMMVVTGLEPESQMTVDIGRIRSTGQQLSLMGIANGNELTAAAVVLYRLTQHPEKVWAVSNMPSKPEQLEFIKRNLDVLQSCCALATRAYAPTGMRKAPYAAAAASAHLSGRGVEFIQFHDGFTSGANLSEGDPRLELRNRALRYKRHRTSTWDQQVMTAFVIKAFNAYLEGREIKLLRFYRDELPMPQIV